MRLNPSRRGFTLVESMVALLLTVLVLTLVYRVLVGQQRTVSLQAQRVFLQTNLRSAVAFIATELREVSTDSSNPDLVAFSPESVTYRATRGSGIACGVTPTSVDFLGSSRGGFRRPQPGRDSLLVYVGAGLGREWISGPVIGVASSSCGGGSSLRLSTILDSVAIASATTGPLFPVRLFEIMQIKLYQSQGSHWLGARSVSAGEVIQPVLGPLDSNGLAITFRDSLGAVAIRPIDVRSGDVVIRAQSSQRVHWSGGVTQLLSDSVRVAIPLRNTWP
ncbi:MAG TPA: prepilin-type N-terminal cleavage/methylation domain-containing protein [Gemmatimonadales bacterium]|nr:prepilin-type N-terminal cleavage/methylation domain-containing protein [Gemmatimonadales bacterium]